MAIGVGSMVQISSSREYVRESPNGDYIGYFYQQNAFVIDAIEGDWLKILWGRGDRAHAYIKQEFVTELVCAPIPLVRIMNMALSYAQYGGRPS